MRFTRRRELSADQLAVVTLPADQNHLVVGAPGTGKTVVALHRTADLYDKGYNPRLIMHGKLLSQLTHRAADELGVGKAVSTFHSWFGRWHHEVFGTEPPKIAEFRPDWMEVIKAIDGRPDLRGSVPQLLIDEGQDFPPEFHLVASVLSESLTVFADENQRITAENSTIDDIRSALRVGQVVVLRGNHRNTREIADFAATFHVGLGTAPESPQRRGEVPRLLSHAGISTTAEFIAELERGRPEESIGVFLRTNDQQDGVLRTLRDRTINRVQLYRAGGRHSVDFREPGVVVTSYASAKGLEFDTVVLPEFQDFPTDDSGLEARMRMYVLATRARNRLFIAYTGRGVPTSVHRLLAAPLDAGLIASDGD